MRSLFEGDEGEEEEYEEDGEEEEKFEEDGEEEEKFEEDGEEEDSDKEGIRKIHPPVKLPKCAYASSSPLPDDYGQIAEIVVGNDQNHGAKSFHIHTGLLKHYSTYFRSALKPEWTGENKIIKLPTEYPDVMLAFFNWIYHKQLFSRLTEEGRIPLGCMLICEVYVFGNCRGIPGLCNSAIDLLFLKGIQSYTVPVWCVPFIYRNTIENSFLREYIVDIVVDNWSAFDPKEHPGIFPEDFLIDCIGALSDPCRDRHDPTCMDFDQYIDRKRNQICKAYHDHSHDSRV